MSLESNIDYKPFWKWLRNLESQLDTMDEDKPKERPNIGEVKVGCT